VDCLIPAGRLLEGMEAGDDGEVAGMVARKVAIVTWSGRRAVHVIYGSYIAYGCEQNPSHGQSLVSFS